MIENETIEKINAHHDDIMEFFRETINKKQDIPLSVFLYDEEGTPYWIPLDQLQTVVDLKDESKGREVMKKYIEHLKETQDINIIQSAIFQRVTYKDGASKKDIHGLMDIREDSEATHVEIYKIIFTRNKKAVIPEKPAQQQVFNREKEPFESMFTNLI